MKFLAFFYALIPRCFQGDPPKKCFSQPTTKSSILQTIVTQKSLRYLQFATSYINEFNGMWIPQRQCTMLNCVYCTSDHTSARAISISPCVFKIEYTRHKESEGSIGKHHLYDHIIPLWQKPARQFVTDLKPLKHWLGWQINIITEIYIE